MSTDRLDVGNLAGVSKIGECTLRGGFSATYGPEGFSARIDSLTVDSFDALGYSYSNIRAAGTYSEKAFDGRLVCHDPNLNLLFQGLFTLSDKTSNGLYKFYANVGYADLHALHLDSRPVSKVSGQVDANYMTVSGKDLIGDLDVMDLVLEDEASRHEIGDIRIKSHSNDEIHRINIGSDFLTGSFVGTKPLTSLLGDITELTVSRDLPALLKKKASTWKNDEYDVTLNVHDAQDVLAFFKPGLYIADSTKAVLSVSKDGEAKVSLTSSRLAIGKNYLKGLNFTVDNSDGSLNGAASCEEASAALFRMAGSTFTFFADEDRFSMGCTYDNRTRDANKGELHLAGNVERSDKGDLLVHARTLPSSIWYNGSKWAIPSSGIEVCGKDVSIESLSASCRDQSIRIAGGLSPSHKDTLVMDLSKMDLSILGTNSRKDLGIAGLATGKVLLMSPLDGSMGLMANVTATGTEFGHSPIGTFLLGSSMDENGSIHVVARNDIDGRKTFDIRAGYTAEEKALEGKAVFNSLDAGYLRPLLYKFVSDISGTASGQLDISVKDGTLKMDSKDCSLDNAMMRIAYTDVPYWFTGPFSINEKGVSLSGITVRDRNNGVGKATGGLSWNNFKNARMDASITIDRMEAFNIAENASQYFYGNQSVTGTIGLSGPTNSLLMDVDVRTDGDGQIHIPLDYNASARKNELLTFKEDVAAKEKEDPYLRMLDNFGMGPKKAKDLRMKIRVDAGRSTEAFVELDRSAGNILAGRGAGIIDMDIRPNRNIFTINGDYTISEGTFHFNAMDIAKRTFTISDGSTIRFNGDIMDSDLGISGRYSTKASLSALIADTSSVSTRRQVNCGIEVSGKLREPELAFSIDIPDIDPTTKSKVESALNTDDKIQKQMVALLLSGSFLPDEQSGIVNNSNTLYNNVAEIMAGQLNNILQKLEIPLDFGLNYQSSESGYNIFDVAISTQLFNNRVLVNGTFGNREYSSSRTGDDMAGDLDIEIKMDKTGQLRLNMFSHAADDYTNYLDNTQRSGAGVSFQKEFDSFKEFFRNLFRCKRKAGTQEFPEREEEKKTIIIE
ncbi:MAG: translocation/assembly module TamB [Bacteroidales bacterium]|nr:translocation/assembly module TamB [Bacteroidales bacterium]